MEPNMSRDRPTWRTWATLTVSAAIALSACSAFNREGPLVTCADLEGGAKNACKEGIIASCKNGKGVTYEVCRGAEGEGTCEASWQKQGAYKCEEPSSSTGGSSGNSTCPFQSSKCASCLASVCQVQFERCSDDLTCSNKCTGPFAAALVPCLQQCQSGDNLACAGNSQGVGGSGGTSGVGGAGGAGGTSAVGGSSCQLGFHRCGDGTCLSTSNICDGNTDCKDGSDESTATCTVTLQCPVALKCSQLTSAEVSFFDYDANKQSIAMATVTAATTTPVKVPCSRNHRICLGAKSGNNIWGAYAPGTGQPSNTPDPSACFACDENSACGANLTCQ